MFFERIEAFNKRTQRKHAVSCFPRSFGGHLNTNPLSMTCSDVLAENLSLR